METRVSMEHWMVLSYLKGVGVSRNRKYCKRWTTWPIVAPKGGPMQEEDAIFNNLRKEFKKPTRTAW